MGGAPETNIPERRLFCFLVLILIKLNLSLLRTCISRIWYDIFTLIALTLHCLSDAKGAIMFPNQR